MKLIKELQQLKESFKYWDSTPESENQRELFAKLVKPSGKSDTIEGELLRAANKIYYDYFNNGFGNNWSGALKYLKQFSNAAISHELDILEPFATGMMPGQSDEREIEHALDSLMDKIVAEIQHAGDDLKPNHIDMLSLTDKTYQEPFDDDFDGDDDEEADRYN